MLCGFADRCVSLWWVPRLPVSPPAARSTSHPSRSSSRRTPARPRPLSPLWEAPGIPNGAGHPPLSPRRPSPHHWPCPADPVPAAESGGDGPLCPQDSRAHCPTSRPSHSTPSPWRSPPQPHSQDTASRKTSLISLPSVRGAGLKGPSCYHVGLPGDWSPSRSHPSRVASSKHAPITRKLRGTWERVRNQGRDKHLFVALSRSQ